MNGLPFSRLDVKFWLTFLHKPYNVTSQTMQHYLKWRHHTCNIRALGHKPCDIKYCHLTWLASGPIKWILFISLIYNNLVRFSVTSKLLLQCIACLFSSDIFMKLANHQDMHYILQNLNFGIWSYLWLIKSIHILPFPMHAGTQMSIGCHIVASLNDLILWRYFFVFIDWQKS